VVGPGTYNEAVNIATDSLSIFGAQAGRDARQGRDDPSQESIVDATGLGGSPFAITAPYVVIDGFTIRGAAGAVPFGVVLFGAPPGLQGAQVVNSIIEDNGGGIFTAYCEGFVLERNLIRDNNEVNKAGLGGYGVYVFISIGVNLSDNAFQGNHAMAISCFGGEVVTITNNTSENDGSFVAFLETEGGLFKHNQGRDFGAGGVLAVSIPKKTSAPDAAVDIGPQNQLLEISDNDLEEGEGTVSNGIAFTTMYGTGAGEDSEGVIIKNNSIKGFQQDGIVAESASGTGTTRYSSVVANQIEDNGHDGINIEAAATYNTNISFFENRVNGNQDLDCNDQSKASGPSGYTLGTHDTWYYDFGNSSYPAGICTPSPWQPL